MTPLDELLQHLNQKFDAIEIKLDYLLTKVENGCYLCGNRTVTCKLSDCPHADTNFN